MSGACIIQHYNTAEKYFPIFPLCLEPVCNIHHICGRLSTALAQRTDQWERAVSICSYVNGQHWGLVMSSFLATFLRDNIDQKHGKSVR